MKNCIYCGNIVSFKGHGNMVCCNCVDKLKIEEPEPEPELSTAAIISRGYPYRYLLSEFKSHIKVEKL